jgi:hypothetical protein
MLFGPLKMHVSWLLYDGHQQSTLQESGMTWQ